MFPFYNQPHHLNIEEAQAYWHLNDENPRESFVESASLKPMTTYAFVRDGKRGHGIDG